MSLIFACSEVQNKSAMKKSVLIVDVNLQDSLFRNLEKLSNYKMTEKQQQDSLAFLILPVEAACPFCRKKAIDSISKYRDRLDERHFVIVSGTGNKIIESYFTERHQELPFGSRQIFIDSTNDAFIKELIFTEPAIYYAYKRRVYQKVLCVPKNIKGELRNFFSKDAVNPDIIKHNM